MANNLSGISYTSNFNNLDGLSIVDADTLIIDGVTIDPTNIVPYVGADKTVNLGAQNIQTTHAPVANADLVNLLALQQAIAYVDAGVAVSFLNKVTTNSQTVAGNVQMNGGLTLTQNTVCNQLQLQSDDNTTMSWTTSVSNGANHDLTLHAVQTSKDVVFRDTGYVEAEGVKVNGATALRAVVTDANKNLATSAVTATELGYLGGVTSGVQTQLDAKASITYVDTQDGLRVLKAGDSMSGTLNMGANKITSTYVPSANADLTNKLYVDSAVASAGGQWTTSGTNIYSNNSGNVGIGTTAPVAKLSVYDWAHFGDATDSSKYGFVQIARPSAPGDNKFHISFIRSGARVSGIGYVNNSDTIGWVNNNDVAQTGYGMYLTNTGNVGIGTTAPGTKLDVRGGIFGDSIYAVVNGTTATNGYTALLQGNATNTGYVGFYQGGGTRAGYLGYASTTELYLSIEGTRDFRIYVAGSERMCIKSTGYVGIGLTNPSYPLHVTRTTEGISAYFGTNTAYTQFGGVQTANNWINGSVNGDAYTNWGQRMIMGQQNINTPMYVMDSTYGQYSWGQFVNRNQEGKYFFKVAGTPNFPTNLNAWQANEYLLIGSGYDINSGASRTAAGFHAWHQGTITYAIGALYPGFAWCDLAFYAAQTRVYYAGALCSYTWAGGWINVSDEREKEDIQDLKTSSSLKRVMALRPKHYKRLYRDGATPVPDTIKEIRHIGFLAQEVMETNPHCVSTWSNEEVKGDEDDGERLGICYNDYIVHLVGAVQEQQKQIETLTQRSQIMEEHARKVEEDLKTTMDAFSAYKEITEARLNKLASLVAQLIK